MEHKIPQEVWSEKKVKVSHLKIFSCASYVHISVHVWNKLDSKSLNEHLLDMVMKSLVIDFGVTKIRKLLEVHM